MLSSFYDKNTEIIHDDDYFNKECEKLFINDYIPRKLDWKEVEDPVQRRKLRNRIIAAKCRRKKENYINEIKKSLEEAYKMIDKLKKENELLKQKLNSN